MGWLPTYRNDDNILKTLDKEHSVPPLFFARYGTFGVDFQSKELYFLFDARMYNGYINIKGARQRRMKANISEEPGSRIAITTGISGFLATFNVRALSTLGGH